MDSAKQFAAAVNSISELSSPFRETLAERVFGSEVVKYLIFSPVYGTANFQTLASVLCVTNRRWLIVLGEEGGNNSVEESSYDSTLLLEKTLILLYGQIKIDFVKGGEAKSAVLHFNSVMEEIYTDAIQYILDGIDGRENTAPASELGTNAVFRNWPYKFWNFSIIYLPKNARLSDGVCWEEIRGGFGRELAPAAAVLLTDRHVVVIAEEKTGRWFQFGHRAKYGAIIKYFPLKRLAEFRIEPHPRLSILELYGYEDHGREKLDIIFPSAQREAVTRLMGKANIAEGHPVSAGENDEI
jgi:hypothetical protein